MSDETAQEDRTEDASQRRLDDARREGKIALSKDVGTGAAVLCGFAAVAAYGGDVVGGAVAALQRITEIMATAGSGSLQELMLAGCSEIWRPGLVIIIVVAAAGLVVTVAQTQGGVWPGQVSLDPDKLFSPKRVIHAFSRQGLADMGLAVVKALAIGIVGVTAVQGHLVPLRQAIEAAPGAAIREVAATMVDVALRGAGVLAVAGLIDLFLVHRRYLHEHRMTKDQIKREAKEDEGDPHIRAARRRRHRELKRGAFAREVPRADALIVNPTHFAIALRYRKKDDRAPRVMAKGRGAKAAAMRKLAVECGIPVVQDIPLARLLHKRVKVGREVPAETYRAVAAVLAFVFKTTGRAPGTGPD